MAYQRYSPTLVRAVESPIGPTCLGRDVARRLLFCTRPHEYTRPG